MFWRVLFCYWSHQGLRSARLHFRMPPGRVQGESFVLVFGRMPAGFPLSTFTFSSATGTLTSLIVLFYAEKAIGWVRARQVYFFECYRPSGSPAVSFLFVLHAECVQDDQSDTFWIDQGVREPSCQFSIRFARRVCSKQSKRRFHVVWVVYTCLRRNPKSQTIQWDSAVLQIVWNCHSVKVSHLIHRHSTTTNKHPTTIDNIKNNNRQSTTSTTTNNHEPRRQATTTT